MRSLGAILSLAVVVVVWLAETSDAHGLYRGPHGAKSARSKKWGRSGSSRYSGKGGSWGGSRGGRYTDRMSGGWGSSGWGSKSSRWNKGRMSERDMEKKYKNIEKYYAKMDKKTPFVSRLRSRFADIRDDQWRDEYGPRGGIRGMGPGGGWGPVRDYGNDGIRRPGYAGKQVYYSPTMDFPYRGRPGRGPGGRPQVYQLPPSVVNANPNNPNFNLDGIPGYLASGVFSPDDPRFNGGRLPRPIVDPNGNPLGFFDDPNDVRNDINEILGGVNNVALGGGVLGGGNLINGPVATDLLGNINNPNLLGNTGALAPPPFTGNTGNLLG